jgi:hypothetical protein
MGQKWMEPLITPATTDKTWTLWPVLLVPKKPTESVQSISQYLFQAQDTQPVEFPVKPIDNKRIKGKRGALEE